MLRCRGPKHLPRIGLSYRQGVNQRCINTNMYRRKQEARHEEWGADWFLTADGEDGIEGSGGRANLSGASLAGVRFLGPGTDQETRGGGRIIGARPRASRTRTRSKVEGGRRRRGAATVGEEGKSRRGGAVVGQREGKGRRGGSRARGGGSVCLSAGLACDGQPHLRRGRATGWKAREGGSKGGQRHLVSAAEPRPRFVLSWNGRG
jgi:hypothetical protein